LAGSIGPGRADRFFVKEEEEALCPTILLALSPAAKGTAIVFVRVRDSLVAGRCPESDALRLESGCQRILKRALATIKRKEKET